MSTKLNEMQRAMLSAAARREDRCVAPAIDLKGALVPKTAAKLAAAGLVKEIKVKADAYVWRRDDGAGQGYALKLTAAGLQAVAVDDKPAAG